MSANGRPPESSADGQVLRWTGRVVTAADLRGALNGHREIVLPPRAIVTPLAAEELRTRGVRISSQTPEAATVVQPTWGFAQDRPYPEVASAVQGLGRDGVKMKEMSSPGTGGAWSRSVAECVARGECQGGVVFCREPGLVCCVANKIAGLRAVAVTSVLQATRALQILNPNFVAVEMPGRTFFEIRQVLRCLCGAGAKPCPDDVACVLRELDGHAHR